MRSRNASRSRHVPRYPLHMPSFFRICFSLLTVQVWSFAASAQALSTYQAESSTDAVLAGGATIGTMGTVGYASFPKGSIGASVTFSEVRAPENRTYSVVFRYATARAWVSSLSVYVNDVDVAQALFPSTGTWGNWTTYTLSLPLHEGDNRVMLRYDADDSGGIDLDEVQIVPDARSAGYHPGGGNTAGWFPQEVSVDKFTGTAYVNVPLATVTAPGIALPVSLNYAASGVQVDDEGGNVGTNWSLQAGLSLRREVRGLPDDIQVLAGVESRYGWLRYPSDVPGPGVRISQVPAVAAPGGGGCSPIEQSAYANLNVLGPLQRTGNGPWPMYDTEPDIFYYAIPGHAGKFVFDEQGQVHTIPFDPITIIRGNFAGSGISDFTIKAPDGNSYFFGPADVISQRTSPIITTPRFFRREFLHFQQAAISFTTAWHIARIQSPVNKLIEFNYETLSIPAESRHERRFRVANAAGLPTAEYRTTTRHIYQQRLTDIVSPTAAVRFEVTPTGMDGLSSVVNSVSVFSRVGATSNIEVPLKQYTFDYALCSVDKTTGQQWYDEKGTALTGESRRFLRKIEVTTGSVTQPLYSFAYHQVGNTTARLPPSGAVDKDYWGYYNANGATTLIPQLYVYPQLATIQPRRPGAPYRLFEAAAYASGGTVLTGADRRPGADFDAALAGTLAEITFSGGGKVLFDYERHRFYDPEARQSLPAGGVRIRSVHAQDPITQLEARRDYRYDEENAAGQGIASGILLHMPTFAFAVPATGATPVRQWTNATVRCGEDLATELFESRPIGYHRVVELTPGRGQVVTEYDVAGGAEETVVDATTACIGWNRPLIGFARQANNGCPIIAPLQLGTETYPFPSTPIYSFRRGATKRIQHFAEPAGPVTGALVRQQDFMYEYRYPQGVPFVVTGLAYEQAGTVAEGSYVYAHYPLLTDFQYVLRQETTTTPQAVGSAVSRSGYRYNDRGELAAAGSQNSDGSYLRTRYKYLTDYALSSSPRDPLMQAMYQRLNASPEQISSDVVETISEVVTGRDVRFKGATLMTFKTEPQTVQSIPSLTRPYQLLRWEHALPLPLINTSDYDSTRVDGNVWHFSRDYKLVSSVEEVNEDLTPVSTRVVSGRQATGMQLGYYESLPVLQISHALASEVVFSDFESFKQRAFTALSPSGGSTAPLPEAARTGKYGVELTSTCYLEGQMPVSSASKYRISLWAKASQPTSVDVSFTGVGSPTSPPLAVLGDGQWHLYELAVNWPTITPASQNGYKVRITPRNTIQVDDVTMLPADANAASTTYELASGKTSETDSQGRTTYYEYGPSGELATVRDHNKAIVRQYERVVAGRAPLHSASLHPSFTVAGQHTEGEELTFTVNTDASFGAVYRWDFGDGSTPATTNPARHTFDDEGNYTVRLQITNAQGKVYETEQYVYIQRKQFSITTCVAGIEAVDDCGIEADTHSSPSSTCPMLSASGTTLSVDVRLLGPYTYQWEIAQIIGIYTTWVAIPGATSASYLIPALRSTNLYRCQVTAGRYSGTTGSFGIEHYQSTNCSPRH